MIKRQQVDIFCDESCHLENDQSNVMVLGAIWCEANTTKNHTEKLKAIKKQHGLAANFELKWTKISPAKVDFYIDTVNYFFDSSDLHFRGVLIPDKNKLNHFNFVQNHDCWYYKMLFTLIKIILAPESLYDIYLDIKDTKSNQRALNLHKVFENSHYAFDRSIINKIQPIRSEHSQLLQLTDLITGAITYCNRGLKTSIAKQQIVDLVIKRSGYSLVKTTLARESKLNLLRWTASGE